MSSQPNPTNFPSATAPQSEETPKSSTMANFETILKVRTNQWKEEQKLLTIGRIPTYNEKDKLIKTQSNELQELLRMYNVPKSRKVLLPIIWDTRTVDPINRELADKVMQHIEKGILITPFKGSSDVDFGVWKDNLTNILTTIAGTEYAFEIVNETCVQSLHQLIPHNSEAMRYLALVINDFLDETGKMKTGTKLFTVIDAIHLRMRMSRTISKSQQHARKPSWDRYKDNVTKFIRKYEAFLRQRFNIQVLSTYLDNNYALKQSEFMNFTDCIPPIIRKEFKTDTSVNISWIEFTNLYIEAEANLAFSNPNYKLNPDTKSDKINKDFNKNKNGFKPFIYKNNSHNNKPHHYKNNHNSDNYKNTQNKKSNGNNYGNDGNRKFNNAKGNNNNNYHNNKPQRGNFNGSNDHNNSHRDSHKEKRPIKSIEDGTFADSVAQKIHEQLINFKYYATLIVACIMFVLMPLAGASLPPSYVVEPCNQPMLPNFYAYRNWEVKTAKTVSLRIIPRECIPVGNFIITGIEMHNNLIIEQPGLKFKEIVYVSRKVEMCGYKNLIEDKQGIRYDRRESDSPHTTSAAYRLIDITKAFNQKCGEEKSDTSSSQSSYQSDTDSVKTALSYKLPKYGSNKMVTNTRSLGQEYKATSEKIFQELQQYTISLERKVHEYDKNKNQWLSNDNLLRQATQQVVQQNEKIEKLENELETKRTDLTSTLNKLEKRVSLTEYTDMQTFKEQIIENEQLLVSNLQKKLQTYVSENENLKNSGFRETSKLNACLNEKTNVDKLLTQREKQITDLHRTINDAPKSINNDEFKTFLKEKGKLITDHSKELTPINNKHEDEKQTLRTEINSHKIEKDGLITLRDNIYHNTQKVQKEILSIKRIPTVTACIYTEAFVQRMNPIETILDTTKDLEYIVVEKNFPTLKTSTKENNQLKKLRIVFNEILIHK